MQEEMIGYIKEEMNQDQNLLENVESIKNMLVSRAIGGDASNAEYSKLRRELIMNPLIKNKLPSFVRTCRTLDEFWGYIKPKCDNYAGRRILIVQEFDPVLSFLEQASTPSEPVITDKLVSIDTVHAVWQKALERRTDDPEGAITSSRTLLEETCKHIMDENEIEYSEKEDLPRLYSMVAETLNLSPSEHTEKIFKQVLGGCCAVINGLGAIRNRLGDAHGKGSKGYKPAPRHAELVVNLSGALSLFLLETQEARKGSS